MKYLTLILFFTLSTSYCFAQQAISGIILDNETQLPLSYAHIVVKGKNKGAISNEDGAFNILCSTNDTLIISFLSYKTQEIPSSYFLKQEKIYLQPVSNDLKTVEILGDTDFLIELLMKAKRKMLASMNYKSKTYFSLETNIDNTPTELLECYYNAEIRPTGFGDLKLKNGRIGICPFGDMNFVSLSTTNVVSDYNFLQRGENRLPKNPLHFNKSNIKSKFDHHISSLRGDVYTIEFTPKDKFADLFSASIQIDEREERILSIKVFGADIKKHPLSPINNFDFLVDLNFEISYSFENSQRNILEKLEFKYDYNYGKNIQNTTKDYPVETSGVFLFYDTFELFQLPYYSSSDNIINDYAKIVTRPYNDFFWNNNVAVLPNKRQLNSKKFFKKNGILINFNELEYQNELFENRVLPWSTNRILLEDLNTEDDYYVDTDLLIYHDPYVTNEFYNFSTQIYLDRNESNGIVEYLAESQINLGESFYYLDETWATECFLNIYFDLVEIAKRKLLQVLHSQEWSREQVDSIFNDTKESLKKDLKMYLRKVNRGKNEDALVKYIEKVKEALQVDNYRLLKEKDYNPQNDDALLKLYNYAGSLMGMEKYSDAIEVYKEGIKLGDKDPSLYYNIGIAYLKLEDYYLACRFFNKYKELGKEIDAELLEMCK